MANEKVFVVDDEFFLLELIKTRLESEGYKVATASSGEEALKLLPFVRPDIVLLDILMPGITGWEVCRRMKEIPELKDIPIIFLTAKDQIVDRIEGMKSGAEDYITKPYDPKILLLKIERQLKKVKK